MKKILFLITAVATLAVSRVQAQTNVPDVPTFFQSVQAYFTSFNTNYNFSGPLLSASTGYKQVTGDPAASYADIDYSFANGFTVGGELQYFGIGSSVNQFKAGVGYNLVRHYDAELNLRVYGGVDTERHTGIVEPEITARKKLTLNTYAEIGMSFPVYFAGGGSTKPTFKIGAGFTF